MCVKERAGEWVTELSQGQPSLVGALSAMHTSRPGHALPVS